MPPTVSTIICVCWWVALGVITAPSFVQVTVVAGPPVEVQVRILDSLANASLVTLGAPACKIAESFMSYHEATEINTLHYLDMTMHARPLFSAYQVK